MSKVGNTIVNFLDWVYGLKPQTVQQNEMILLAYAVLLLRLHLSSQQMMEWAAVGMSIYGLLRAIDVIVHAVRDVKVSKTGVTGAINALVG